MIESNPRFLSKHKTAILVFMLSLPILVCGGLDRWSEMRREVHEICEGNGSIWTEVDFQSDSTLLPLAQAARLVRCLIDLEHRNAIAREDHEQAFHSLLALIGVARSLEKEPIMTSQIVHGEILRLTLARLKQAVEFDFLDKNQLQQILVQLKPLDDFGNGYRLSFIGERAMSQPMYDVSVDDPDFRDLPRLSGIGNRRIDALASLKWLSAAESVNSSDLTTFFIETDALNDRLQKSFQDATPLRRFETSLSRLLMMDSRGYSQRIVWTAMMLRIAKLAMGLRLYEREHGAWPDSLDSLTSDQIGVDLGPITPIGTKPFGYCVQGDIVELWGFYPSLPTDETPDAPIDPSPFNEGQKEVMSYFLWSLQRDRS